MLATAPSDTDRRLERIGSALALGALLVLGLSGIVVAWDGAWEVAHTAITGLPTFGHGRVLDWLIQAPMLLARAVGGGPVALTTALGLATAAVPAIALLGAWRMVLPDRRDLLVFPFLGIGLGLLGGQAVLVSEAVMVVALGWPLVLGAALGRLGRYRWLTVGLIVALATAHPFAGPVLVLVAAIAAHHGWRPPPGVAGRGPGEAPGRDGRHGARLVAALGAIAALVVLRYLLFPSAYEAAAVSVDRLVAQYRGAVSGAPLVAIAGATFLAAWVVVRPRRDRLGLIVCLGAIAVIAVAMTIWAADPAHWQRALMFRTFTLAAVLPTYLLSVVAARRPPPAPPTTGPVLVAAVGGVMALVLSVQAAAWIARVDALDRALAARPPGCLAVDRSLPVSGSALDHWSLTSLVLLREGRTPAHLVVPDATCAALDATGGVPIKVVTGTVEDRAPVDGWFDLRSMATAAGWLPSP